MTKPKNGDLFSIIDSIQIVFAGIAFSLFLVTWGTSLDVVYNVFKPDYIKLLSYIRISFLVAGLIFAGFSGKSVFMLGRFVIQAIEIYKRGSKELTEVKKELEEKGQSGI